MIGNEQVYKDAREIERGMTNLGIETAQEIRMPHEVKKLLRMHI